MGNTINTLICDREEPSDLSKNNLNELPPFEHISMRYPVYYRGFHRPFIH
jgi:hypothetical protein